MSENVSDRKQDRREQILTAAAAVFSAAGYSEATCDDIAEKAGVSKGTLYNYFKSKQDLFTQLFLSSVAADEAAIDEMVARSASAREKLEAVIGYWFQQFSRYHQMGRLVLEFWSTAAAEEEDGTFTQALEEMYGRYRERMTKIFKQGEASGEFELVYGPSMAAAVVLALFDGLGLHSMMGLGVKMDEKVVSAIQRGMLRALGAAGPEESRKDEQDV
jgi:AcrR family transcriptional regulator